MRKFCLFVMLLFAFSVHAQGRALPISEEEKWEALSIHNASRALVGVPRLKWSDELSEDAQIWAESLAVQSIDTLVIMHNLNSTYGENIYASTSEVTCADASRSWLSEKRHYVYEKVDSLRPVSAPAVGHYTQIIWSNTERIGMGKAIAPNGYTIIVTIYDPPGNIIGQYPYKRE